MKGWLDTLVHDDRLVAMFWIWCGSIGWVVGLITGKLV